MTENNIELLEQDAFVSLNDSDEANWLALSALLGDLYNLNGSQMSEISSVMLSSDERYSVTLEEKIKSSVLAELSKNSFMPFVTIIKVIKTIVAKNSFNCVEELKATVLAKYETNQTIGVLLHQELKSKYGDYYPMQYLVLNDRRGNLAFYSANQSQEIWEYLFKNPHKIGNDKEEVQMLKDHKRWVEMSKRGLEFKKLADEARYEQIKLEPPLPCLEDLSAEDRAKGDARFAEMLKKHQIKRINIKDKNE